MKNLEQEIKKMESSNKELKEKVQHDRTQFDQYKRLTEGKLEQINEDNQKQIEEMKDQLLRKAQEAKDKDI